MYVGAPDFASKPDIDDSVPKQTLLQSPTRQSQNSNSIDQPLSINQKPLTNQLLVRLRIRPIRRVLGLLSSDIVPARLRLVRLLRFQRGDCLWLVF